MDRKEENRDPNKVYIVWGADDIEGIREN